MQAAETPRGEPILAEQRSIISRGGSRYANIPASAERIVSFGDGGVEIRVFHDHVEVWPLRTDGGDESGP